jgi:glycosyltransferase involved in cell wall biosynthesis
MSMIQPELRVGYVVKRYPRYSETFIVNEILAHEKAGLDVRIFSLLPPQDTHFQDAISRVHAPVHYLPALAGKARGLWDELTGIAQSYPKVWEALGKAQNDSAREVLQALVLARVIREQEITHLHAHFATSATTVARLAADICGIPYSFTAHAKDIFHENVETDTLSGMFADAAFAVTVSDYNKGYLYNRLHNDAGPVELIYNGLDLSQFTFQEPAGRRPEIIAVGRLVEKKGFEYLVDACHELMKRGCQFHCRIIGTGELEQELVDRIHALGLEDAVEMTGPRPQQEVKLAIRSAAVLAAPCVVGRDGNRDGLPTVLLESMALGTPCISTDVTGIPEVLNDEVTGLLVPQEDPIRLADALERLLTDPDLGITLALQARRLIEDKFDVHRNTAQLRDCIAGCHQPRVTNAAEVI